MSKLSARDRARFEELDRIYRELPAIECKRKCAIACSTIPLTELEAVRLHHVGGRKPKTIPLTFVPTGEARSREVERCIYLHGERTCKVHEVRPLICRIWGLVKSLSCPHGCVPDRWITDREFVAVGLAIERVGGRLLETSREGLGVRDLSFTKLAIASETPGARSDAALDADAERTRGLRAIFGGRIIAAIDNTRS